MLKTVCPNCGRILEMAGEAERRARKDWGLDATTSAPVPAFCSTICQATGEGALDVRLGKEGSAP
ncbi:MAG: hypothetical protein QN174_07605 [Armatimonadota bacterium]|nr:hypothetical protein [Armatimonadota bacterium]